METNNTGEVSPKKCKFCSKARKKFGKYIALSAYVMVLLIIGQIQLIKIIWDFISNLW
jgi:hypothetical protein